MHSLTEFETKLLSEGYLEYPSGKGQQNVKAYGKPFKEGLIYVSQNDGNYYCDYTLTEDLIAIMKGA